MKRQIVNSVSKKLGIHPEDVGYIFDAIFKEMALSLHNKKKISIRGFGNFFIKKTKSREMTFMGKKTITKPKCKITFSPSIFIKDGLNS